MVLKIIFELIIFIIIFASFLITLMAHQQSIELDLEAIERQKKLNFMKHWKPKGWKKNLSVKMKIYKTQWEDGSILLKNTNE